MKCTKCHQEKPWNEFRHGRGSCKICDRAYARERYQISKANPKPPRPCSICGITTTNYQAYKTVCRKCLAKQRCEYNMSRRIGLSKGMIALWKAGYSFEDASKMIKNNRNYKRPESNNE